jgi:arylsulfatase A-like enzyme
LNVILITVDCLRADAIGALGHYTRTPHLDRLVAEGVTFTTAVAAANTTDPSHASILTSSYPPAHGCYQNAVRLGGYPPTLAEVVSGAGYRTCGAVSVEHLSTFFGFSRGFQTFFNQSPYDHLFYRLSQLKLGPLEFSRPLASLRHRLGVGGRHWSEARRATDQVIGWLGRAAPKKFFCWLHYFDAHANDHRKEQYAHRLEQVDREIGRLLGAVGPEALVVVCGDHGEGFGEHGFVAHGNRLYDELILTPLIFSGLRGVAPRVIHEQVSHIDLAPTILEALGLSAPSSWTGESLLPLMGGGAKGCPYALSYGYPRRIDCKAIRTKEWKYVHVCQVGSGDRPFFVGGEGEYAAPAHQLFNLQEDPGELCSVLADHPEVADNLKARFFDLENLRGRSGAAEVIEVAEDMLRALGYMD